MGTSISEIYQVLLKVGSSPNNSLRVLDIGTQNVYLCTADEVIEFIRGLNDVWELDNLAAHAEVVAAGSALHSQLDQYHSKHAFVQRTPQARAAVRATTKTRFAHHIQEWMHAAAPTPS
jgi:hypothetical protein